jgi:hypothetical protein
MTDKLEITQGQRFQAALMLCGLSQRSAAAWLDVSYSTVTKWCQDKNEVPTGAIDELRGLWDAIKTGDAPTIARDGGADYGAIHAGAALQWLDHTPKF